MSNRGPTPNGDLPPNKPQYEMKSSAKTPRATTAASPHSAALINAAAFQDHLTRSLGVDLRDPVRKSTVPKTAISVSERPVPAAARLPHVGLPTGVSHHLVSTRAPLDASLTTIADSSKLAVAVAKRWKCDSCGVQATADAVACTRCGAARARDIVGVAPKLTLAQHRGLVPAPAPLLSPSDWEKVEVSALARARDGAVGARRECTRARYMGESCSICMEGFGLREQALLSCSHVFHRSCIESFERFAGAGRRCCPLCRTPDYQTRRTRQAAIAYIQHCASMLQAVYRGHVTRFKYFEMRKQLYIACGGGEVGSHAGGITIDSGRKRVFQAQLLGDLHRRLRVAAAATSARIVDLFEETDRSLEASRAIMRQADERMAARLRGERTPLPPTLGTTGSSSTPLPSTGIIGSSSSSCTSMVAGATVLASSVAPTAAQVLLDSVATRLLAAESRAVALADERRRLAERASRAGSGNAAPTPPVAVATSLSNAQWTATATRAVERKEVDSDCPICITEMGCDARQLTLLSCSHVYHEACIHSLESFVATGSTSAHTSTVSSPAPASASNSGSGSISVSSGSTKSGSFSSATTSGVLHTHSAHPDTSMAHCQTIPPPGSRCPVCRAAYVRTPHQLS